MSGTVAVECSEFGENHDTVIGVDENMAVARPRGAETRENTKSAGERVTSDERLGVMRLGWGLWGLLGLGLGLGLGPEI